MIEKMRDMQQLTYPKFREDTKTPKVAPPAGSCDCQVHLFGKQERYPTRGAAAYAPPEDATVEAVERMHQKIGISRGVLVQATAHGMNHDIILDALKGRPNYRGVALIDETTSDRELQRLHDAGCRAARFNFWKALNVVPTPAGFTAAIDRIKDLGWHVKIHAVGDEWFEIQELLKTVKIPLVVDHMGHVHARDGIDQPAFKLICELLRRENWYVLLSNGDRCSEGNAPWDDIVPFGRKLLEVVGERALWCTDWPHVRYEKQTMANDGDLLDLLYRFTSDERLIAKILVDNPKHLFGFNE